MNKSKLKEAIRKITAELQGAIAKSIIEFPLRTYREIAEQHGVSEATVLNAAARHGLSRSPGPKPKADRGL
jgi:DNA-binding Lrp family transcriptional regulator